MNPINRIIYGVCAALVAALGVAVVWLMISKAHMETRLAQTQSDATACHMANDEFADRVKRQNTAIEAIDEAAAARIRQATAAQAEAEKVAQAYLDDARRLSARRASGDACRDADNLISAYLKGKR